MLQQALEHFPSEALVGEGSESAFHGSHFRLSLRWLTTRPRRWVYRRAIDVCEALHRKLVRETTHNVYPTSLLVSLSVVRDRKPLQVVVEPFEVELDTINLGDAGHVDLFYDKNDHISLREAESALDSCLTHILREGYPFSWQNFYGENAYVTLRRHNFAVPKEFLAYAITALRTYNRHRTSIRSRAYKAQIWTNTLLVAEIHLNKAVFVTEASS